MTASPLRLSAFFYDRPSLRTAAVAFAVFVLAAFLPLVAAGDDGSPCPVDWPAFMARHDMAFRKLPTSWTEAPHFGNAMVGSMLYQDGNLLKLQVFRADVHDHRDNRWGWTAYSRPRLRIGHFALHPVGKLTGCDWRKDLWNAELTGTITTDKGEIRIRHFTHTDDLAIITELTPSDGEKDCHWTWHPEEARTTRSGYPVMREQIPGFAKAYGAHYEAILNPWQPNPAGRLEELGEVKVWIQDLLAGGQYATAWQEVTRDGTRVHVATIAHSHPDASAARTAVDDIRRFAGLDRRDWTESHRRWWHNYYPRSFITLPDRKLESLYWQTVYRFGCTSRTGRCMVDTSGLWFQGQQWPYFTADWNIQSAHWPVYAANRLDQGQALVDRLHQQRDELVSAVLPEEWRDDSAFLPLAVAWDMRGRRDDDKRYYDLVGNLPWTMHNAWWQYRFSMDDAMLREKIYPLLRRSICFYLHMLREGPDGKLHLPPTYSPETKVVEDCNFDLSLLRWGCHTLLKACERLHIEDPLIPRWREVIARLPDFPADEFGFRLGGSETSQTHHQHLSHLLMIYPLYLANIEQQGKADTLERSLARAYATSGPGGRSAMVHSHAGLIATALGRGDLALDNLRIIQSELFPNGLWYDPPCIESTLSIANIVQDMLIQSWSDPALAQAGPIRVFPALPASWKDVEFHDLRTEGAFLVSAKRVNGKTVWVRIKSLAGEPCRIRPGIEGAVTMDGPRGIVPGKEGSGIYQIDLRKGETVVLKPAA